MKEHNIPDHLLSKMLISQCIKWTNTQYFRFYYSACSNTSSKHPAKLRPEFWSGPACTYRHIAAEVLASLCICTHSPEPLLLAIVISTEIFFETQNAC